MTGRPLTDTDRAFIAAGLVGGVLLAAGSIYQLLVTPDPPVAFTVLVVAGMMAVAVFLGWFATRVGSSR